MFRNKSAAAWFSCIPSTPVQYYTDKFYLFLYPVSIDVCALFRAMTNARAQP